MTPCQQCNEAGAACYAPMPAADQPRLTAFEADGLWVAQIVIDKAGTLVPQHVHASDHLTMLAAGGVRVKQHGEVTGEHSAPDGIFIAAGVPHLFETMTDGVILYCVHNTSRTGGQVVVTAEHQIAGGV